MKRQSSKLLKLLLSSTLTTTPLALNQGCGTTLPIPPVALPGITDTVSILEETGFVDPPTTPPRTPDVVLSPPTRNFSEIPQGFYFGENFPSHAEIRLNGSILEEENGFDGFCSITFDNEGYPLNWDDELDRRVRVEVGYTEHTLGQTRTITGVRGSNNTVDVSYTFSGQGISNGIGRETFTYQTSQNAMYCEAERSFTSEVDQGQAQISLSTEGWADGPFDE